MRGVGMFLANRGTGLNPDPGVRERARLPVLIQQQTTLSLLQKDAACARAFDFY